MAHVRRTTARHVKRVRHSLQTLRIFSAVAQAGGVTAGAAACGLTQSAATKHIRALEDSLGTALLERTVQGVVLTPGGERYLKAVRRALRILDDAAAAASASAPSMPADATIALGVAPAVAQRWLIPRQEDFHARHGIRMKLVPRLSREEALSTPLYAEIRFGTGHFPGWTARYLIGRDYRFVLGAGCACRLAERGLDVRTINRPLLEAMPLLFHVLGPDLWDEALASLQQRSRGLAVERIGFEQYSVLIPAAVAGQGLALVPRFLVTEELRTGQLVEVDRPVRCHGGFYLLLPRGRRRAPALERLSDWLAGQARPDA